MKELRTDESAHTDLLNLFFYIFGILFLVLVGRARALTISSAHVLTMMILTRAMAENYRYTMDKLKLEKFLQGLGFKVKTMNLRLVAIEPYPTEENLKSAKELRELKIES
jgi:hypothetical protein